MRARVVRQHWSPQAMDRVRQGLCAQPGVRDAQVSAATGSVLVEGHDPDLLYEAIASVLEVIRSVWGEERPDPGVDQVVRLARAAGGRLRSATAGSVSLRWLVPAVFACAGLRQLFRQGIAVGAVPWYVLPYYGADSFLELYPEHAPRAGRSASSVSPPDA